MYQEYISHQGAHNLASYKYQSAPYTLIDKAMKPFWNFTASLVPRVTFLLKSQFLQIF